MKSDKSYILCIEQKKLLKMYIIKKQYNNKEYNEFNMHIM